jgi:hypothetical protein
MLVIPELIDTQLAHTAHRIDALYTALAPTTQEIVDRLSVIGIAVDGVA